MLIQWADIGAEDRERIRACRELLKLDDKTPLAVVRKALDTLLAWDTRHKAMLAKLEAASTAADDALWTGRGR